MSASGRKRTSALRGRLARCYSPIRPEVDTLALPLVCGAVVPGQCPIVSFDQANKINGRTDWYYLVDVATGSMEWLNP